MLLEAKGDTEDNSAPKSVVQEPPSTPEMSALQKTWWIPCFAILCYLMLRGLMKSSWRVMEAANFHRRWVAKSFLREAMRSCLRRPLQVNL